MNHNFVIFEVKSEYYKIAFSNLFSCSNVEYIDGLNRGRTLLCRFFYRLHHSRKLNLIFKLPLKRLWFRMYFQKKFEDEKPLCFLFDARILQFSYVHDYLKYLRGKHPNAQFVLFYQDLIKTYKSVELSQMRLLFDLILTYDNGEAKKYKLVYHPTIYSKYIFSEKDLEEINKIDLCDVYFVGLAKNRLSKILDVYKKLTKAGLICDFYISGVSKEQQFEFSGIHYNQKLSYVENLRHIQRARCILEIMQEGAEGATLRNWEAICYNKILLTDNLSLIHSPYYNTNYISIIRDGIVDFSIFTAYRDYDLGHYMEMISPINLLNFIESYIK